MNEIAELLPDGGFARFACDALLQSTLAGLTALAILCFAKIRPETRACFALLAILVSVVAPCSSLIVRVNGLGRLPSIDAPRFPLLAPDPQGEIVTDVPGFPPSLVAEKHDAFSAEDRSPSQTASVRPASGDPGQRTGLVHFTAMSLDVAAVVAWILWLWAAIWAAASVILAARLFFDCLAVRRLRRETKECSQSLILDACRQAAQTLKLSHVPVVATSDWVSCPTVLTWGKPCVLIPDRDTSGGYSPRHSRHAESTRSAESDRWFAVFCHELGHLRRRDGWSWLLVEVMTIILPWQPLMWLLRKEFQRGCEEACDDWALFGGVDPLDYAATLTEWAPRRSKTLALGIRNRHQPIRRRIERLLRADGSHAPQLSNRVVFAGVGLAGGMIIVLAFLQTGVPPNVSAEELRSSFVGSLDSDSVVSRHRPSSRDLTSFVRPSARALSPTTSGDARLKHWNDAQSLGFSANGDSVFSFGTDGVIRVWEPDRGQPSKEWGTSHTMAVLSGDGRRLFLASRDGRIEVCDSSTGHFLKTLQVTLPGNDQCVLTGLSVSHDGTIAACCGRRGPARSGGDVYLALWSVESQQSSAMILDTPADDAGARGLGWQSIAVSLDGSRLAAGRSHFVSCWSIRTAERLYQLEGVARISALAFSHNAQQLASGDALGNVTLWNAGSGQQLHRLVHSATISALAFTPCDTKLATSAGNSVQLWDLAIAKSLWSYQPANSLQRSRSLNGDLHIRGDGQIISIAFGNRVVLLDTDSGNEPSFADGPIAPDYTELTADRYDNRFYTGDANGQVSVWDFETGNRLQVWQGHRDPIDAMAVSATHRQLVSKAVDGSLILWDIPSGSPQRTSRPNLHRNLGADDDVLAFSADGQTLATIAGDRTVAVWDVNTGELRDRLKWNPQREKTSTVIPSRGRFLLAEWQVGTPNLLRDVGGSDQRYHGFQLAVSPDRRYAAGGVYGSRLEIWDLKSPRKRQIDGAHSGRLQCITFSPDSVRLATAAADGRVAFWDTSTGASLGSLEVGPPGGIISKLAFSPDGRYLATLNGNGTLSVHSWPAK